MIVETLRPNGLGDEENIQQQVPGGGNHWDKVDDVIFDGQDTRIQESRAGWNRDLYNIENHSGIDGYITSIKVIVLVRSVMFGGQDDVKIAIKTGGVAFEGPEFYAEYSLNTFTPYFQEWVLNPNTGDFWAWAEINSLQIGLAMRSSWGGGAEWTVCSQVYVEVNVEPRVGAGVEIHDTTGNLIARLENALSVGYEEAINRIGACAFELPSDDPKAQYLVHNNEVWLYYDNEFIDAYKIAGRQSIRD